MESFKSKYEHHLKSASHKRLSYMTNDDNLIINDEVLPDSSSQQITATDIEFQLNVRPTTCIHVCTYTISLITVY